MSNLYEGAAVLFDTLVDGDGEWFTVAKGAKHRALAAKITGTGEVSATITVEGRIGELGPVTIATISLTGTDDDAGGDSSDIPWPEVRATVASITGTGARVVVAMAI